MSRLTMLLPMAMLKKLAKAAKSKGQSKAAIVRLALAEYLAKGEVMDDLSPAESFNEKAVLNLLNGVAAAVDPAVGRDWTFLAVKYPCGHLLNVKHTDKPPSSCPFCNS